MYGLGGSLEYPDLLADNPNPRHTSDPGAPTIHLTRAFGGSQSRNSIVIPGNTVGNGAAFVVISNVDVHVEMSS